MVGFGFVVQDPEGWLTLSQKQKIKAWCRTQYHPDRGNYLEVLDHVHYAETLGGKRYNDVLLAPRPDSDIVDVRFRYTAPPNLKERLHAKLRLQKDGRSLQKKGEDWSLYHRLLQSPAIRMIPVERLSLVLPDPDGVRAQRANYEAFQKICPDPTLKEYFALCLAS